MEPQEPRSILEVSQGLLVELGESLQLDKIYPPLACLYLGDETGRPSEPQGDLPLGQLGLDPRFLELSLKAPVGRTVKGVFWHCLSSLSKQAYNAGVTAPELGAILYWRPRPMKATPKHE